VTRGDSARFLQRAAGSVQERVDANDGFINRRSSPDVESSSRDGGAVDALYEADFVVIQGVAVNLDARHIPAPHARQLGR
jgi:hypothetical protein